MALNIKNQNVEQLLEEVIKITGESKTEAIRKALEERYYTLSLYRPQRQTEKRLREFLEEEIWSDIPPELLGKQLTKQEEEEILGYGEDGV
jgi:antitoxin VapB